MPRLRRFVCPALLALLALLGAGAHVRGACEARPAALTLMVYMCGSDLESEAGLASGDLREMMAAMPSDGSLQIVALAAGSTSWESGVDADMAGIYRLTSDGIELAEAHPVASMGDPQTLERLLRYGWERCPAERYALILWDHGAGPMLGVCFDECYATDQGMDSLSLYYPFDNKARYTSPWASQMDELAFSEGYRRFIRQASAIWLGESLADWSQARSISADAANRNHLTLQLTAEQVEQFAGARLLVLEEGEPGKYRPIYTIDDVELWGEMLTCTYSGEALFVVDRDGRAYSSAVYYALDGDDLYTLGILWQSEVGVPFSETPLLASMRYRKNDEGVYAFAGACEVRDDGIAGKSFLRLEDFDTVDLATKLRLPTTGDDGRLLPYSQWEYTDFVVGDVLYADENPNWLAFLPLEDGEARCAMFEITDLQGSVWTSDMISLPNENRTLLPVARQTLLDSEACTLTLESAELSLGTYPALELTYSAINHTDAMIRYSIDDFMFDDTMLEVYAAYLDGYLDAGESETYRTRIKSDAFRDAFAQVLDHIALTASCVDCDTGEELGKNRVEIPMRLDTRALVSDPRDGAPLDSEDWNGVRIELMAVGETESGGAKALVRFANPGDQEIHVSWLLSEFSMNGEPIGAYFESDCLEIPAGCNACQWLKFYNPDKLGERVRADRLHSFSFRVYAYDEDRYDMQGRRAFAEIRLETGK